MVIPIEFYISDNGIFPNSHLPVLVYKEVLDFPFLFPGRGARKMLSEHGWTNNWKAGIYTYHHYHSNTHEAMIVIRGETDLLLGGENGRKILISKGDAIVIPAGVAHKNLGRENDVTCVGGYPEGKEFDMKYGKPGERPGVDLNIAKILIPASGPVDGKRDMLITIWNQAHENDSPISRLAN